MLLEYHANIKIFFVKIKHIVQVLETLRNNERSANRGLKQKTYIKKAW